jgi:hypothetical protein
VLSLAAERFARRLAEETAKLRIEMAQGFDGLWQEMAGLRQEMTAQGVTLRQEISAQGASLRQEMASLEVRLVREIAASRVEAIRWSFAFWIGQLVAMAGLLAFMLRGVHG